MQVMPSVEGGGIQRERPGELLRLGGALMRGLAAAWGLRLKEKLQDGPRRVKELLQQLQHVQLHGQVVARERLREQAGHDAERGRRDQQRELSHASTEA